EAVVAVGSFVATGEFQVRPGEGGLELLIGHGGGNSLAGEADLGAAVEGVLGAFGRNGGGSLQFAGERQVLHENSAAHFALQENTSAFGGQGGAGGGQAEAIHFQSDADEVRFGHIAFT